MLDVHQAVGEAAKASRRRWIIGLSIVALFLARESADDCIEYYKRFNKTDRTTVAHVVEFHPGEPGSGDDPGSPPWALYQFTVNGRSYDGEIKDELTVGDQVTVRYNPSDPNSNHPQYEKPNWPNKIFHSGFLLFLVLAALVYVVRHKELWHPT
jgi:hypothetical protein